MPPPADREAILDGAIDHALRELVEQARSGMSEHPEVEELVAYQEGRLADPEAERVRRHLVACPECAREVLQLEDFALDEPEGSDLLPSAEQTAEDWAAFQRRVAADQEGGAIAPGVPDGEVTGAPASAPADSRGGWLLAASVLFALVGVGFWLSGLQDGELRPFEVNLGDGGLRREASAVREVELPPGTDPLLRLMLGDQVPYADYRVEILDAEGEVVWSQSALRRQVSGHFAVLVPRRNLPAGEYRSRLLGLRDGKEAELATYPFRIVEAADE